MNALLQSPVAVGSAGLLLITMAAIWYIQTRSRSAAMTLAAAILTTLAGIAFERAYLTPREQVLRTIGELFQAIESNDLPGVLAVIDPTALEMRADAELLMPMFEIESAGEGGEVTVELPRDPRTDGAFATAKLKPLIKVQHLKSGATGAYFNDLTLELVRRGDAWLLSDYAPAEDWRAGAAKLSR